MAKDRKIEPRPFHDLEAGPKNQHRRPSGGGGAKSIRDIRQHGERILHQIEEFQRLVDQQNASRSPLLPQLPDKYQVILETTGLSPQDVKSLGLEFIEEREDGVLVTVSADKGLENLAKKTQEFIEQRTARDNPKHAKTISNITGLHPSTFSDKVGSRLQEVLERLNETEKITVDVELGGGRAEDGEPNRQQFYDYIRAVNSVTPGDEDEYVAAEITSIISDEYSIHRVRMPIYAILDLLSLSKAHWVLEIDLIPEIEEDIFRFNEVTAASVPPLPSLSQDIPRVVVIDSGIVSAHPLFSDANGNSIIGREINFLPDSVEDQDFTADEVEGGHGTAVASIAAYGTLKSFILEQAADSFPSFWIENAKIMLPESRVKPGGRTDCAVLYPSQHPRELMRRVVEAFNGTNPVYCKIFNLSVGSAPHRIESPISTWAEEIDNLIAHTDILFVISAGNIKPDELERYVTDIGDYPRYLLDKKSRIRNPGQAYSAITVGAVSEIDLLPLHLQQDNAHPIAKANHPAPFTRTGILKGKVVKPEVVEWGGNLYNDTYRKHRHCNLLSIPVANRDFATGRLVSYTCGTSLAAPRVSHLAALVQQQNIWASANLIRALIINSAEWPQDLFINEVFNNPLGATSNDVIENTLKLCGYGIPNPEKALSANSHCLIFKAEDFLSWVPEDANEKHIYTGKVSFFSLGINREDILNRIPSSARVRVKITLAYNPPVRKNYRKNYQGVELYWDLRRIDETLEEFQEKWILEASKEEDEEDTQPAEDTNEAKKGRGTAWNWHLHPVLNPGVSKRRGTVICDWFDGAAWELPETFDIAVLGTVAYWLHPPESVRQNYALVVSIEVTNLDVPIYDIVRIQQRIRVQG